MCMRSGSWRGAAALAHGWPEPGKSRRARKKSLCKAVGATVGGDSNSRKKRMNVVNLDPSRSIYRGSTGSAR
jgi:hypothetical protein